MKRRSGDRVMGGDHPIASVGAGAVGDDARCARGSAASVRPRGDRRRTHMTEDIRPNIFPALRYNNARAAIDWLTSVFGFENDGEHAAPDGSIAHAQLHFGAGVVGLSSAQNTPSDHPWSKVRQGIYVRVDEVDAHHDRAKRAGADIVMPLKDMDYGSREYAVRDPEGHLWGFGTYDMAGPHTREPNILVGLHYRDFAAAPALIARAFRVAKSLAILRPRRNEIPWELRRRSRHIL